MTLLVSWAAIIFGVISAVFWVCSALMPPIYPMGYMDGPPQEVEDQIRRNARLNTYAASFTAASVLAQAIALLLQKFSQAV